MSSPVDTTTMRRIEAATVTPDELVEALQHDGAVLVTDARVSPRLGAQALADAAAFFALPDAEKAALAIGGSPCFRGYSRMDNERDWREQIHFGRERPRAAGSEPWWRLQGPNRWPADAGWRQRLTGYLGEVEQLGIDLLARIAAAFGRRHTDWLGADPYVLMKCIGYHPQPPAERRRGVAAHVDFSLLTLTLQDDVGGLEVRTPDGGWTAVPAGHGAWLVNIGELLQFVTGNRLLATPHRVVNPSSQRLRCSLPLFINPSLATTLVAAPAVVPAGVAAREHVHAVLDAMPEVLPFGAAEWRRKGENGWCARCAPVSPRA